MAYFNIKPLQMMASNHLSGSKTVKYLGSKVRCMPVAQ